MAVAERKTWAEMVADFLREVGTLYLIFGVLDAQLITREWIARGDRSVLHPEPFGAGWYVGVIGVSVMILFVGALIERLRL